MSRIDEALRRALDAPAAEIPAPPETVFAPAWPAQVEPRREAPGNANEESRSLLEAERYPALRGFSSEWRERLVTGPERNGLLVEQFRRLAGLLHNAQKSNGICTIMVTSAAAGDGKTLTAVNLALVLSESYRRRVLLVDADLRRPSIGSMADVTGGIGLSEALKATSEQKLALVQLTHGLTLLPAGEPDPDPIGGLTSRRMRRILEEAAQKFDWVILDAPPVGPVADASLLAEMVDGALFVVRAGQTHYALVQKGIETLGRERILGVVLNGVQEMNGQSYQAYYHGERRGPS